jgi:hypothetical protein
MLEMSSERATTMILPLPLELFRPFLEKSPGPSSPRPDTS